MSESKPSNQKSRNTNAKLSEIERRHRQDRVWFFISLGLHVMAVAALVYLTPVREVVREIVQQSRPQQRMSGGELEKLAEAIETQASERIRRNVNELNRVQEEISEVYESIDEKFAEFDRRRKKKAAKDAVKEMETAVRQMEKAAESIEQDAPIEETDRYQALAEQAQQRAGKKLGMVEYDAAQAAQKQQQAEKVHQEAKSAHDQHRDQKLTLSAREEQRSQAQEEAQNRKERAQELEEADNSKKEEVERKASELDEQERQVEELNEQAEPPEKALSEAAATKKKLQSELKKLKNERKNTKNKLDRASSELENQQQRVQELTEQVKAARKEKERLRETAAEKQRQALQTQKDALNAVKDVVARRERMLAEAASGGGSGGSAGPQMPQLQEGAEETDGAEQQATDVPTLYEQGRETEDEIAERLKEVRAMDLAMVRDMKLEEASENIDLARPVRPELDPELLREAVRTDSKFERHKQEVEKALRETTSMVDLAHRMLEMANQSVAKMKFGSDVPMAGMQAEDRQELELIIREMAMEDVSGRFSDMSAMMQAADEGEQGQTGQEQQQGQMGAGQMPRQDIKDLTEEMPEGGEEFRLGMDAEGEGGFAQLTRDVPAIGARMIKAGGIPSKWMYVDSWWTIGPFPNPNRRNIDRKFPPDSLVDLDATYIGKGGKPIRWRFVQSHKPQVLPPNPEQYGIWYAYTEIYSDEPRDVWIATGTDDRGILKVNGTTVWISSKRLKGWDIDEVWRKVHFRKGVNRILFRVENGWLHIGWSLTLRLTPPSGQGTG